MARKVQLRLHTPLGPIAAKNFLLAHLFLGHIVEFSYLIIEPFLLHPQIRSHNLIF
jgi:hypothetical protein